MSPVLEQPAVTSDIPDPQGRFGQFVQARRQEATDAGGAVLRLAVGSVAHPVRTPSKSWSANGFVKYVYVWRRKGAWVWADLNAPDPAPVNPVNMESLAQMVLPLPTDPEDPECRELSPGAMLVLPDRSTARALVASANSAQQWGLARLISVTASMTSSSRVVVLTEALSRKVWLPLGVSESDLTGISHAVGVGARSRLSAIRRLLLTCLRHGRHLDTSDDMLGSMFGEPGVITRVLGDEAWLAMTVGTVSGAQHSARFSTVSGVSAAWDFVTACDPIGRYLARIDGTVFDVWMDRSTGLLHSQGPMKMREDKMLVLCPDHELDDYLGDRAAIAPGSMRMVAGEYVMSLDEAWRGKTTGRVNVLRSGKRAFTATQDPFLGGRVAPSGARWFTPSGQEEGPPALTRDVPLSVSLAGAPRDAAHG